MSRTPMRLALVPLCWLLIGAGITVAVAWGAVKSQHSYTARLSRPHLFGETLIEPAEELQGPFTTWGVVVPPGWPLPDRALRRDRALWTNVPLTDGANLPFPPHLAVISSYGWPCRALRTEAWFHESGYGLYLQHEEWTLRSSLISIWFGAFPLPLRPLWPGFAVDALLYAALAWGLWQLPLLLRRRHRRARNRCLRCGYSLAGLAAGGPCPECGRRTRATEHIAEGHTPQPP